VAVFFLAGQGYGKYANIGHMTDTKKPSAETPPVISSSEPLPTISMVLGIASLLGPGFLLGIPAIITSAIALKKGMNNHGFSIAGLVTGIVSTLFSLFIVGFAILVVILSLSNPQYYQTQPSPEAEELPFQSAQT
jgi:hypothetical protein